MPTITEVQAWRGRDAIANDGDKLGTIDEIYVDKQSGEPAWLAVKTGLFGTKVSFVPLAEAREDDGSIVVPYDKGLVKDAPLVDADGELSETEEAELYAHYGRSYEQQAQTTVPVQHEEVRIEREPITDANAGQALDGPEISEEEHEVTLHAVSEQVRKEHINSEGGR